jgi:AcrR family transcriptional regulator
MKKPAQRLSGEERREQILRCATTVFARTNYRAARIADIASEVGISEAMIYKHFPSKKSIFLEILEHMSQRIILFWQQEVDREPDALQALRNMVLVYFRRVKKHPDELRIHSQAVSEIGDEAIRARLRKDYRSYMRFVEEVIKNGIRQGAIRENADVEAMTFLYTGGGIIVNMMILLAFDKRFNEQLLVRMSDHLLGALKA